MERPRGFVAGMVINWPTVDSCPRTVENYSSLDHQRRPLSAGGLRIVLADVTAYLGVTDQRENQASTDDVTAERG